MKDIIKKIAKNNNTTVRNVTREIQSAIANAAASRYDNEQSRKIWDELSPNGKIPSVEEFILFVARKVNKS